MAPPVGALLRRPILVVGNDDVGCIGRGDSGVEEFDQPEGEDPTHDLGRNEARSRGRGDAGKGVGEHPPMVMAGLAKLVELVKK